MNTNTDSEPNQPSLSSPCSPLSCEEKWCSLKIKWKECAAHPELYILVPTALTVAQIEEKKIYYQHQRDARSLCFFSHHSLGQLYLQRTEHQGFLLYS